MRIGFFGTSNFAVPVLRSVAPHVVLVVSQPDRPRGRGHALTPTPVRLVATELGLPVETPERSRAPEFVERLRSLELDLLLVVAYGQILSMDTLNAARQGGVNLHGSLLPKYRGAAPIQRAIMEGQTETGVTLMQMAKAMDAGDVIDRRSTPISAAETYGELSARLALIAGGMAADWVARLCGGSYPRVPQDEKDATYAPKIVKEDGRLDVSEAAELQHRRFRAVTPEPGAVLPTTFGDLKVLAASLDPASGPAGCIGEASAALQVFFAHGSLLFERVQFPGRKPVTGVEAANGLRLKSGHLLAPAGSPRMVD